jgi:hypothetical protein
MEGEEPQEAQAEQQQTEKWYALLTRVTPLSKYLALALFIALPFAGFWLGIRFSMYDTEPTRLGDSYYAQSQTIYYLAKLQDSDFQEHTEKRVLHGADISTFTVLSGDYAKDNDQVWRHSDELKGADPATFRVLSYPNGDYPNAVDRFGLYRSGSCVDWNLCSEPSRQDISGIDPNTFVQYDNQIAADKGAVYDLRRNKIFEGVDPATFVYIDPSHFKDANAVYENTSSGEGFVEARRYDPTTFELHPDGIAQGVCCVYRDINGVYGPNAHVVAQE